MSGTEPLPNLAQTSCKNATCHIARLYKVLHQPVAQENFAVFEQSGNPRTKQSLYVRSALKEPIQHLLLILVRKVYQPFDSKEVFHRPRTLQSPLAASPGN